MRKLSQHLKRIKLCNDKSLNMPKKFKRYNDKSLNMFKKFKRYNDKSLNINKRIKIYNDKSMNMHKKNYNSKKHLNLRESFRYSLKDMMNVYMISYGKMHDFK